VHALLSGIDERSAHIVVEHRALCAADGTRDNGRVSGAHREPAFLHPPFADIGIPGMHDPHDSSDAGYS
jgi:hypothetical protein